MIPSKRDFLYIFFSLLAIVFGSDIQAKDYESIFRPSFINFKPVSSPVVLCMVADANGMTWMGTDRGLVVYDGYRDYTLFRGTDLQTVIHTVMLSGDKILMGTDGGLRVAEQRNLKVLPPSGGVRCVRAMLRKGSKIVVGGIGGVDVYDLHTNSAQVLARRLPQVYSLLDTPHGLFVGTLHGLYVIRNGRVKTVSVGKLAYRPLVNAMAPAKGGGYWIGTEGALYLYDGHRLKEIMALHANSIKALCQMNSTLYIGTDDGLYMMANRRLAVRVCQDIRVDNSLSSNIVWALGKDKWNNLLVGTDRGLSILRAHEPFRYWSLSAITGSGDGNTFGTLLAGADGMSLWAGGDNGLISMSRQAQGWKVTRWYRQDNPRWSISHNRIRKLHRLSDGTIVACTDHGLFVIDPNSGQTHNILLTDSTGRYNGAWAYDIVEDGRGRCWVAAYAGGIFIIDRRRLLAGRGRVTADAHLGPSLIDINVGSLAADKRGNVWAAAYSAGIDCIDAATLRVSHIMKESSIDKVMADDYGSVWATMTGKIVRFDHGNRKDQRIFSMADHSLTPTALGTADGALWVAANNDICVFRPNAFSCAFSLNGQNVFSMASPFVWTDAAGKQHHEALLGGEDALMAVCTDDLEDASYARLKLTGIEVNDKLMCINDAQQYLDGSAQITFHSNENNFTFLFSDNPQCGRLTARYAYQMEGVGKHWTLLPAGIMQVSFNGLPHGSYRLHVSIVDGQGRPSKEVYNMKVTVLPPWYLTWLAKTTYVLLFLALAAWAVRFVWMRRELRRERQARNEAMEQSARRSKFFASLSERLKTSAGIVLASAYHLREHFHGKQADEIDMIRRSGAAICLMASEALDLPLSSFTTPGKPVIRLLNLTDLCQLVVGDCHESGRAARLSFSTDYSELIVDMDVVAMLGLLDAIVKFVDDDTLVHGSVVLSAGFSENCAVLRLNIEQLLFGSDNRCLALMSYGENRFALMSECARTMGAAVSLEESNNGHTIVVIRLSNKVNSVSELREAYRSEELPKPDEGTKAAEEHTKSSSDGLKYLEVNEDIVVKAVTAMIEEHLADADLNVQQLTELTGFGTKLIYRRVKAVTGYTPVNYIRQLRMRRAAVLLKQGRFAVFEVMYMVGFSTQSYFSKCFSHTFGMSPAEYASQNVQS